MRELIKKQREEFNELYRNSPITGKESIEDFISKVRKETAETVCDRMIGEKQELVNGDDFQKGFCEGLSVRIREEEKIKQQINKEIS